MASDIKRSSVFCFLDGQLTVKTDGYGEQNGWGNFAWDEGKIDILPHDEKDGSYVSVDIPPSELVELRDFLLRLLPLDAAAADAPAQQTQISDEVREAMVEAEKALEPFAKLYVGIHMHDGYLYDYRLDAAWLRLTRNALNKLRSITKHVPDPPRPAQTDPT